MRSRPQDGKKDVGELAFRRPACGKLEDRFDQIAWCRLARVLFFGITRNSPLMTTSLPQAAVDGLPKAIRRDATRREPPASPTTTFWPCDGVYCKVEKAETGHFLFVRPKVIDRSRRVLELKRLMEHLDTSYRQQET